MKPRIAAAINSLLIWHVTDISIIDKKFCQLKATALLYDGKWIMWAGSGDLNEYFSSNFNFQMP